MPKGVFNIPKPINEPVLNYAPGSRERQDLLETLRTLQSQVWDIPMYIGGEEVRTENKLPLSPPHNHKQIIGYFYKGDDQHVERAIQAAIGAKYQWENMPWEHRAAIFLKAADLLAGPYRAKLNAATMLCQSKNPFQAEIDSACELIDFFRFNAFYMQQIYQDQPDSQPAIWNRMEYRPLEGFVLAITPFNFTSIAGNLPSSPAIMGNTVVWKPAFTQIYSAYVIMEIFREAGLPDGVINLVYTDGPTTGKVCFYHPQFAGVHFTGSTGVFKGMWKTIANNLDIYHSFPSIVGETGGKDFIIAHKSANPKTLATALVRGAFEYQGQKCSAASRAYIPDTLWPEVKNAVIEDLKTIKMGDPADFGNFFNAVIDEKSFDKLASYIDQAKKDDMVEIIAGGHYDKSVGYFIEPTIILSHDPMYVTMCEELFGPILTLYVYQAERFEEALELVDKTSPYALTGSIFAQDRYAIALAEQKLTHSAGNFYINDKPTGAVVGQQPFGGARASGTNDKAGSKLNLLRWVSARSIKENFTPPSDYRYPFLNSEK